MLNQKQNIFSNTLDNMEKNMEVKNTYKKVGDFQKGRDDLDVNINNKKLIVTESGNKNMTLNDFVFNRKNKKEKEEKEEKKESGDINDINSYINETSKNNINLHKTQSRRRIKSPEDKNNNNDNETEIEEINTNAYDDISNPFMKEKKEDINIEEDNEQTKIKNNTINKKKKKYYFLK